MRNLQAFLDGAQVAKDIFDLRPDYRALLVAVDGIGAVLDSSVTDAALKEAEASACALFAESSVTELPHIAAWRKAYKSFGAKPNKTRNSLEALTRRVNNGLPRINWLTDTYNAISVKHQIPVGGEDLDKYSSPPRLVRASGEEDFQTVVNGEVVLEHPHQGEVVWCDGNWVTCRHWNWRQSPRTALDGQTSSLLLIFDALDPVSDTELQAAADDLVARFVHQSSEIRAASRLIQRSERQ